jgi:hypothetical protein
MEQVIEWHLPVKNSRSKDGKSDTDVELDANRVARGDSIHKMMPEQLALCGNPNNHTPLIPRIRFS